MRERRRGGRKGGEEGRKDGKKEGRKELIKCVSTLKQFNIIIVVLIPVITFQPHTIPYRATLY